jgi:hypothetical protein
VLQVCRGPMAFGPGGRAGPGRGRHPPLTAAPGHLRGHSPMSAAFPARNCGIRDVEARAHVASTFSNRFHHRTLSRSRALVPRGTITAYKYALASSPNVSSNRGSHHMRRLVPVVAACLGMTISAAPVAATPSSRSAPQCLSTHLPEEMARSLAQNISGALGRPMDGVLRVTDATQVWLNGRAVKYRDVPPGAEVLSIELAPDRKTILTVHFRTK